MQEERRLTAPEGPSQTSVPFPGLPLPHPADRSMEARLPEHKNAGLTSGTLATHEITQRSPWKWSSRVSPEHCRAPDPLPNWAPTTGEEKGVERDALSRVPGLREGRPRAALTGGQRRPGITEMDCG